MRPPALHFESPLRRWRPWMGLGVSVVVHLLAIGLTAGLLDRRRAADEERARPAENPSVEMVYLQPPVELPVPMEFPPPAVMDTRPDGEKGEGGEDGQNLERAATPPPAERRQDDRAEASADAAEAEKASRDQPTTREGAPPPREEDTPLALERQPPSSRPSPEIGSQPTAPSTTDDDDPMVAEARRIFGRQTPRQTMASPGGPTLGDPGDAPSNCVPRARAPGDTAVRYGTAVGRILSRGTGRPVAGAHLQMIGTPFAAFTDAQGWYRFRFDLSLVEHCRAQFVWVTAPGYARQRLTLVVGNNVASDDVLLRRD